MKINNIKKRLIIIFTIVLSSISMINAQSEIKGTVADSITGEKIFYASYRLLNNKDSLIFGGLTDIDGKIRINEIKNGEYVLKINNIGYKEIVKQVKINGKSVQLGIIPLSIESTDIDEVLINGNPNKIIQKADRVVFTLDSMAVKKNNTLEAIRSLPGIIVDAGKQIKITGYGEPIVYVNGIERSADYLTSIKPEDVLNVELITTGALEFGSGSTPIINIITNKEPKQGVNIDISLDYYTRNIYNFSNIRFQYGFKKITIFAGYRLYYVNNKETSTKNRHNIYNDVEFDYLSDTKDRQGKIYQDNNFNYGFDYQINKKNFLNITSEYVPNSTYSNQKTGANILENKVVTNNLVTYRKEEENRNSGNIGLYYLKSFENKRQSLTFIANKYNTKINLLSNLQDSLYSGTSVYVTDSKRLEETVSTRNSNSLELKYSQPVGKIITLKTGYRLFTQNMNSNYILNKSENDFFNYKSDLHFGYITSSLDFKKVNISLEAGINRQKSYEDSISSIYNDFTPNASASLEINDNNSISISYRNYITFPYFFHLIPFVYQTDSLNSSSDVGNKLIKPTKRSYYNFSYIFSSKLFYINSSVYLRTFKDIVYPVTTITDENVMLTKFENLDYLSSKGVNISISYSGIKKIKINPSVDLSFVKYNKKETAKYQYELSLYTETEITDKLSLSTTFSYMPMFRLLQGSIYQSPELQLSMQYSVLKSKGIISCSLNFINSNTRSEYIYDEGFFLNETTKKNMQYIYFGFSYSISKGKTIKQTRTENNFDR